MKNSTKDIKRRQRSIANTQKVTRAMEMVAASKMRKAQLRALSARPFAESALSILSRLAQQPPEVFGETMSRNIYFSGNPEAKKTLLVVVASDKGLIGGLNANVINAAKRALVYYREQGQEVEAIVVGTKSKYQLEKAGVPIVHVFEGAGDYADPAQTDPVADFISEYFSNGEITEVVAIYTEFISTLKQTVAQRRMLPLSRNLLQDMIESVRPETGKYSQNFYAASPGQKEKPFSYIFEPSSHSLLETLVPFLFRTYMYHIILESNASEHSARMMAMRNASSNAERLLEELTLAFNKARQSAITQELSEVTSGAEALSN